MTLITGVAMMTKVTGMNEVTKMMGVTGMTNETCYYYHWDECLGNWGD